MKRPSYRRCIQYLSHLHETSATVEQIERKGSTRAIAFTFQKLPVEVAIQVRKRLDERKVTP